MRIGAKVPNSGPLPMERGIAGMAAELEHAGFESLWVSDHIVMPRQIESRYPFAADGKPTWATDTPYFDAMVALAVIASATQGAAIGTAVLVLPLRHPVILAKQAASIDVLSGGRLVLGVGAGWLAEEFDALDVPFGSRGQRFTEWLQLLRACWSGEPGPFDGEHYHLPGDVFALPAPEHDIPVLVGGDSSVALSRAATTADGWLAHQSAAALDFGALEAGVEKVREKAKRAGRAAGELWTTVRIIDSAKRSQVVADALPRLRDIGVDEVVVDIDWGVEGSAAEAYGVLSDGASW
ncbi:MAG TPA: TIGR03619 family F420-dependent LLM class oxidoreductase [Acidimicrobiales bacterium]|nr:TIGR03619 family F420-dependent LLM class oxidoreductase [Acidimicrobiales bacterium]